MPFCFQCAHELEFIIPDGDDKQRWSCPKCQHIHYENPKVIVGVIPYYKTQILLCKRAIEPKKGLWTFPCGFMECNETIEDGAKREAKEEAGIQLNSLHYLCTESFAAISQVYIIYYGALSTPSFNIGPETSEAAFFSADTIPWPQLAFPPITSSLKQFLKNQ